MTEQMSFSPEEPSELHSLDFKSAVEEEGLPTSPEELEEAIARHQQELENLRERIDSLEDNPNGDSIAELRKQISVEEKFISLYKSRLLSNKENQEVPPVTDDSMFADAHRALEKIRRDQIS